MSLDVISDTRKTVCMTLRPVSRDRWITGDFTAFTLDGCKLTQFCVFLQKVNKCQNKELYH